MKEKGRWMIWALRAVIVLSILGIVFAIAALTMQLRHAAQLAALGIPDLCDTTHIKEYTAIMYCSGVGLLSIAGLSWLRRED